MKAIHLFMVFVVVSGCLLPTCRRPYILVGDKCCLDENGDRICDEHKPFVTSTLERRTSTTQATQVTSTSTTTILSTSTTTSTSTTSSSTTVSLYQFDKILHRLKDRNGQLTSTTTTTTLWCYDSDGSRDYSRRADNATGYYVYNESWIESQTEYCINTRELLEYYCVSGKLYSHNHECPTSCVNGRCCRGEGNRCSSDLDCCEGSCQSIGLMSYCIT